MGSVLGLDDLVRRLLVEVMLPVAYGGWEVGGQEVMSKVGTSFDYTLIIECIIYQTYFLQAKSLLPKDLARQEWTRSLQ